MQGGDSNEEKYIVQSVDHGIERGLLRPNDHDSSGGCGGKLQYSPSGDVFDQDDWFWWSSKIHLVYQC